jgi:hypothetical protein
VGYWGTVVVARPEGLLTDVGGLGFRHRWLRELGGGWQLLETSGWDDPPDLREGAGALVERTGQPAIAAYISNSSCAVICAATPGRTGVLTHLWDAEEPCGVFPHAPDGVPGPAGRTVGAVADELHAWAAAAGLRADHARLHAVIAQDGDRTDADELLFTLVKALGVERIGRTLPWAFDIDARPFRLITDDTFGLGLQARSRARRTATPEPWVPAAIALEHELWAALYRPGTDVDALAGRVREVVAGYEDRDWDQPGGALDEAFPALADGTLGPSGPGREWADGRATV